MYTEFQFLIGSAAALISGIGLGALLGLNIGRSIWRPKR
jgi:hypothetical protein